MASSVNEEEDECFEDDVVFDRQQLLIDSSSVLHRVNIKRNSSTVHRTSSGKFTICAKTLGLCGAFFGLGLCVAIPDFTFSSEVSYDIQIVTSSSLFSNLLTARSLGYIIGSFIAGVLFDRYNRQFLLFLSLLLTSVFIVAIPWCYTRLLLEIDMIVLGITIGFLSTGGNVLCLDLWGRNSGPFMQALHFSFALGTLVAPLMAGSMVDQSPLELRNSNHTIYLSLNNGGGHFIIPDKIIEKNENSSELNFLNVSGNYEGNCINKLSVNVTDYQLHVNFTQFLKNCRNRTVSTVINKLPLSRKIYSIQGIVGIYSTVTPIQCNLTAFEDCWLDSSCSYSSLEICDLKKLESFNKSIGYNNDLNHELTINSCDCNVYLNRDFNNVNIINVYLSLSSACENFTLLHYSGNSEVSDCNFTLTEINEINLKGKLEDSSLISAPNVSRTEINSDIVNYIHNESEILTYKAENYNLADYHLAYLLTGAVIFTLSVLFFVFLCRNPRDPKSKQEEFGTKSRKVSNICVDIFLVPLTTWFLFLCVGLQATINQLLSLYAVKIRGTLPSSTDNLKTIFSASFTTMRFASVFFAIGFSPDTLLVINLIMFSFGTLILSSLGGKSNEALCTGCSVLGLGLATMVPTTILWIEQYIHVSNKITVVFVVGSTLGEMLFPFTVYKLMILNSDMFLYVTILVNVLISMTLVCLWMIMGKYTYKFCFSSNTGYHLAKQNDEEDLSMTNILKCLKHN